MTNNDTGNNNKSKNSNHTNNNNSCYNKNNNINSKLIYITVKSTDNDKDDKNNV